VSVEVDGGGLLPFSSELLLLDFKQFENNKPAMVKENNNFNCIASFLKKSHTHCLKYITKTFILPRRINF
jgi:hypothetical protein